MSDQPKYARPRVIMTFDGQEYHVYHAKKPDPVFPWIGIWLAMMLITPFLHKDHLLKQRGKSLMFWRRSGSRLAFALSFGLTLSGFVVLELAAIIALKRIFQ